MNKEINSKVRKKKNIPKKKLTKKDEQTRREKQKVRRLERQKKREEYINQFVNKIKEHNKSIWIPKNDIVYNNVNNNTWFSINEAQNVNEHEKINFDIPIPKNDDLRECIKVRLLLTSKQKKILNNWFNAYTKMYNETIRMIKENIGIDKGRISIMINKKKKVDKKDEITKTPKITKMRNIKKNKKNKVNNNEIKNNEIKNNEIKNNEIKNNEINNNEINNNEINNNEINNNEINNNEINNEINNNEINNEINNDEKELKQMSILNFIVMRKLMGNIKDDIIKNSSISANRKNMKYTARDNIDESEDNINKINIKNDTHIKLHMIDTAIQLACANYKSALSNLRNGHIKHFRIRYWKYHRTNRILELESDYFKNGTICSSVLGQIKAEYETSEKDKDGKKIKIKSFDLGLIQRNKDYHVSCKLQHMYKTGEHYLFVPKKIIFNQNMNPQGLISIDPGIRTFGTGISEGKCVKIGDGIGDKIKYYLDKIDKMKDLKLKDIKIRKITNIEKYDNKKRDKWRQKKLFLYRKKITDYVDELHWKSINYLTKNYTTILIGNMSVKRICAKDGNLTKMTKRIGQSMRLYVFKQRLKYKCECVGIKYEEIDESYTSKICSNCGQIDKNLGSKKKYDCKGCKIVMDRDMNGARGIYIKKYM